jgi:A/G-specific adenine glycosylase
MMDLGATVCTPGAPKCLVCPLADFCRARAEGDPARLPVRARKAKRPERRCVMYWIENPEGAVLLRKRPAEGLLGGMTELPSTPWRVVEGADGDWPDDAEIATHAPLQAAWERVDGEAVHVFTHFRLTIRVMRGHARDGANAEGFWVRPADFSAHALPTVIKKAVKLARDGA